MNQSAGPKRAVERVVTLNNLDKSPEDHKTLDQLRQRVETLTRSLESLNNSFFRQGQLPGPGLPSWYEAPFPFDQSSLDHMICQLNSGERELSGLC